MIIDSSGKGPKVWKSEVISPAVIVDSGSGSHVGSFRVDCTGSKQTNYTKICFIRKPNNTIRVLIGLCKFWGHGPIVLYRISWYTESYYKGFLLYLVYYMLKHLAVVTLLNPAFDWYLIASVPAILYAITYYIGPHYDGILLYSVSGWGCHGKISQTFVWRWWEGNAM